ncbi:acetyltransferase family protein, partial [Vibrio parahaemolyticus V-223/04]
PKISLTSTINFVGKCFENHGACQ